MPFESWDNPLDYSKGMNPRLANPEELKAEEEEWAEVDRDGYEDAMVAINGPTFGVPSSFTVIIEPPPKPISREGVEVYD
jgi:hypothetical protein